MAKHAVNFHRQHIDRAVTTCRAESMGFLQLAFQAKEEEVPQHPWGAKAVQAATAAGRGQVGAWLELQVH